ncbi:uridine kinase [bacterium]|nr:uridine kinase [candidate division CSSED10-310 bacterium]
MNSQIRIIETLAKLVGNLATDHPVRVAVDGPDCAGKTTITGLLDESLRSAGRHIIQSSIDGFHHPASHRHRQGRRSPQGYYEDSFDLDAVINSLLIPLGPGGDRSYRTAHFDCQSDAPVDSPLKEAPSNAILLFDGVFLHRPQLLPHWDFTIFVKVSSETTLKRALRRDVELFGSVEVLEAIYRERYLPAQEKYAHEIRPAELANAVVINDDPADPILIVHNPDIR